MKIKFDSTQQYQLQSVSALVDLFNGQPLNQGDFTVAFCKEDTFFGNTSVEQTELGLGNNIVIDNDTIYKNLVTIQENNDLDPISQKEFEKNGLNFTVEMETGTGKTYVYLRTIFELSRKYGFKKFIIVVPGVAIREGVLKNIEITNEHFRALYNNIEFEYFVYDSKKTNRLRQFAMNNQLQVMVINIDAFRKDFSDSENERKSNVIFKEDDRLSGRKPIEFVQATRPIVIIDEPQSVDSTAKAQETIKSLNPACIFRFSATHKNLYNQVYKLDPIRAFELRLVKQIVVASVTGENAQNNAYVKLLETDNTKGIRARIRIQVHGKGKVQDKDIWVKYGADLFVLSNEREVYKNGYEISEICTEIGNEYIEFASQGRLYLGNELGGISEDLSSVQIRSTIKKHLDKEKQLKDKGIKVLSLFFIDKVANYRFYDDEGKLQSGKFFILFEKHYNELIQLEQYKELAIHPVEQIHDGYFSQDKKGILKDTKGDTMTDNDTYTKIMRNKEQLLSLEEPLKFIFSHSALREGWDNPNVFQICTLNESQSMIKKRQEIGRGLRLPVNRDGERVFDNTINKLTVIANESYDDFARKLQKEYEEDCGVTFGKVPKLAFKGIEQVRDGEPIVFAREESEKIWNELYTHGFLDLNGKIQPTFKPTEDGFTLGLSKDFEPSEADIITVLQSYELTRHIKKDEPPKILKINKQVFLDPDFEILWNKINSKTTYQVAYSTNELIENCVDAIIKMDRIEPVSVNYREAELSTGIKGIGVEEKAGGYQKIHFTGNLPNILAYLQKYTELTRKTLVEILTRSERIKEFAINPQRFMDQLVSIINRELHKLMIDGIKYEKLTVGEIEWSMQLFKDVELQAYLEQCISGNKSVYGRIIYDSEIEKKFAQKLECRSDIKLFVKLPTWFKINTPIGQYNPDWAIVKHDDDTIYMVRETKGTKDFEKLRNSKSE